MMLRPRRLLVSVVVLVGAALVAWNGTLAGQSGAPAGRVAHVWRRSRQHAVFPARPDHRGQLQQARSRLAVQDRCARPAARVQFPVDAADGRRRAVHHGRARAARSSRSTRPPARCCGCTARTKARAAIGAPRRLSGRGLAYWTDGKEARILYVTPGYRLDRARREDRRAGRRFRRKRRRRSEAGRRPGHGSGHRGYRAACRAGRRERRDHHRRRAPRERRRRGARPTPRATCAAFDVRTGKRKWIFHTIPLPGEFGNDTWEKRLLVVHRQHRRVGADVRRRRARSRLPAG